MQGSGLDSVIQKPLLTSIDRTNSQQKIKNKTKRTKSTLDSREEFTSHSGLKNENSPNRFTENKETKYHSQYQAKCFCLLLIQDLVRLCNFDIYAYSLMLEILLKLSFEGEFRTTCKISLTIFLLVSKFCTARGPHLSELISWARCGVEVDEVVECERQLLQGLKYELPLHWELNYDEIRAKCFQYQSTIFLCQQ